MNLESDHDNSAAQSEMVSSNGDPSSEGIVYVLKRKNNDQKQICKVGFTKVSGDSRAKNYTDGGWEVVGEFLMPVWLAKLTEKEAHKELKDYWMDPAITGGTAHEVFYCEPELAEVAVAVAKKLHTKLYTTAEFN